jgi:Arc/MetJ-type ribon-helix-helix transcriptional regulator
MGRTQIYLGDEELEALDRAVRSTGASRSELIRRAVRSMFGEKSPGDRLRALEASAGSWHDRGLTGGEYVEARRGDLNLRLRDDGAG